MKRLTLALLALSLLLIAPRPHNFTDRPRQDDRPMALGDYRKDTLSCAEDYCQDFEYSGGCHKEYGWPVYEGYNFGTGADCDWDGDGVTSGTNAIHLDEAFDEFEIRQPIVDSSATGILYSQFSVRVISATNANFGMVYTTRAQFDKVFPKLMMKGTTSEFQIWCEQNGQSKSSSYTYTEDVDYVVRIKSDSNHPVTEQAEIYNISMSLLDTLTCASDGAETAPSSYQVGDDMGITFDSVVVDDIRLSLDAF